MSFSNCTICNSPNSRSCASCRSVAYCSLECQQADWPVHKTLCKTFKAFQSSTRHSSSSKLGLLLPVDSKTPRLVWIECEQIENDEYEPPSEYPHVQSLLGTDKPFPEHKPINRNVFRGFDLDHRVYVVCRETFLVDGSKTNICVAELTRGAMLYDWRGPIVILSMPGTSIGACMYQDITLSDLRTAVDYFLSYGDEPIEDLEALTRSMSLTSRPRGVKAQGVRINCLGDQKVFGVEQYVAVAVPPDHPVFQSTPTGISTHMGLPLLMRKYPPDRAWKGDKDMPYENLPATFMNLNADMSSEQWGWAPLHWQNDVGSVIVVRKDGKDLTARQAEAFAYYCQFKLQPVFEDSLGGGYVDRTREAVVSQFLTRKKFEQFFDIFKREQARDCRDESWLAERSPYNV
jgi:MYND finger